MTSELRARLVETASAGGWQVVTPKDPGQRGGHIALAHAGAGRMSKALRGMGVVPDHRPPDILRLAPPAWAVDEGDIAAVVSKILDAARGVQGASGDDSDQDLVP